MISSQVSVDPKPRRRPPMSRYTRTMLGLLLLDAVLVLFLTFGAVFPSRLRIPDSAEAFPETFYNFSAKRSPFTGSQKMRRSTKRAQLNKVPAPMTQPERARVALASFERAVER